MGYSPFRMPLSKCALLLTQAEGLDDCTITSYIAVVQIVEQCATAYFFTVYVPAVYSLVVVSPGSVTDAVAPSGMVNVHVQVSPS